MQESQVRRGGGHGLSVAHDVLERHAFDGLLRVAAVDFDERLAEPAGQDDVLEYDVAHIVRRLAFRPVGRRGLDLDEPALTLPVESDVLKAHILHQHAFRGLDGNGGTPWVAVVNDVDVLEDEAAHGSRPAFATKPPDVRPVGPEHTALHRDVLHGGVWVNPQVLTEALHNQRDRRAYRAD